MFQYFASYDTALIDINNMMIQLMQPCAASDSAAAADMQVRQRTTEQIRSKCAGPHERYECTRFGCASPTAAGVSSDVGNQNYFSWFSQQSSAAMNSPTWLADMDANYVQAEVRSLADECTSMMADHMMKTRDTDMMQSVKAQSRYDADRYSGACASGPGARKRVADALDSLQAFGSPSTPQPIMQLKNRAAPAPGARVQARACVGTPDSELAQFDKKMEGVTAQNGKPSPDIGAQATYQWSYADAVRGLELLEPHKACMGQHYEGNRSALIGMRASSKSGCEALSCQPAARAQTSPRSAAKPPSKAKANLRPSPFV